METDSKEFVVWVIFVLPLAGDWLLPLHNRHHFISNITGADIFGLGTYVLKTF